MSETITLPPRLQTIADDFRQASREEKLELLLEYADTLPPLPDWLSDRRQDFDQVHECMTPVFIYVEERNSGLFFHFDIPPESPTIRGFAQLMRSGVDGSTPEQILQVPGDFAEQLGLQQALSPQRLSGIRFIIAHMKRLATRHIV